MINKLLTAVLKKHGPIEIIKIDSGSGTFRIVVKENLDTKVKNGIVATDCFDLEQGLITILSENKSN